MFYFFILSLLFVFAQLQQCDGPNCLFCSPLDARLCITCEQSYQNQIGNCIPLLNSESAIKDEHVLLPDVNIENTEQPQKDIPITQSQSDRDQIRQYFHNYAISFTLNFQSTGNNPSGVSCLYRTQNNICVACNQNFFMTSGNMCVPSIKKCLQFQFRFQDGAPQCTKCLNHFRLLNNNCIDVGCQIQNYYYCSKCKTGYSKSPQGYCFDSLCDLIRNGQCLKCSPGFSINNEGQCVQQSLIVNSISENNDSLKNQENQNFLNEQTNTTANTIVDTNTQVTVNSTVTTTTTNQSVQILRQNDQEQIGQVDQTNSFNNTTTTVITSQTEQKTVDLPPNCLSLSKQDPKRCNQCSTGFYLVGPQNLRNIEDSCIKISRFCISQDYPCSQCSNNTLQQYGTCIDQNCEQFDKQENSDDLRCLRCSPDYFLGTQNSLCQLYVKDENCLKININVCLECKKGYFRNTEGRCQELPQNCEDPDCLYCKQGYYSLENSCKLLVNCDIINRNVCEKCQEGYVTTNIGTCIRKLPYCLDYSVQGCMRCSINSNLMPDKTCRIRTTYQDENCRFNRGGRCELCNQLYYVDPQTFLCEPVNSLCETYNKQNGHCLSCYAGYVLNSFVGQCVEKRPIFNCAQEQNDQCIRCSNRYYLYSPIECRKVNQLCNNYNGRSGICQSCYQGYSLLNGECLLDNQNSNTESSSNLSINQNVNPEDIAYVNQFETLYCKTISSIRDQCEECFQSFYLDPATKKCVRVNPLCKDYDRKTGQCLSCYNGYELAIINERNACILINLHSASSQETSPSLPPILNTLCLEIDAQNNSCVTCPPRYYKKDGLCVQVVPTCKEFNEQTGECLECFGSYKPSRVRPETCELSINQMKIDNCEEYSEVDQLTGKTVCLRCIEEYYLEDQRCNPISILCEEFNHQINQCSKCRANYVLYTYATGQTICNKPALGFDENCETYGVSAYCESCKNGFQLINGLCIAS